MAFYRDLNALTPLTKSTLTDDEVIYQSVYHLLDTRSGERLFVPEFCIDMDDTIFDLATDETALDLFRKITSALEMYEPRVKIDYSKTNVVPDVSSNSYSVQLVFSIISNSSSDNVYTISGTLKRYGYIWHSSSIQLLFQENQSRTK